MPGLLSVVFSVLFIDTTVSIISVYTIKASSFYSNVDEEFSLALVNQEVGKSPEITLDICTTSQCWTLLLRRVPLSKGKEF